MEASCMAEREEGTRKKDNGTMRKKEEDWRYSKCILCVSSDSGA